MAFSHPIDDRYFEDYVEGDVHTFGSIAVEADEIIAFAKRFDPQRFHIDPEAAKQTLFGGLIASGWHTAGLMMRLCVEHYLTHVASLGSPGLDELRWLKPVRPGDRLSVRVTVLKATPSKSKPDRGVVTSFIEVFNQSEEVVMTLKTVNMIARRRQYQPAMSHGPSGGVLSHCTVSLLTGPRSRRIVVRTREAAMIVKNILLGRRGNVVTIEPTADLAAAVKLLAERRIGAVVIVGADHRIVGILSERDIVRALAEQGPTALNEPVGQVMTRDVKTCCEDDTIESLMGRMTTGKFRHMPVEEQGKLVGIVSIGDAVKNRVEEIEREAAALRDYIRQ
jgi:acyl dehydratase/CBS domain-containing protein